MAGLLLASACLMPTAAGPSDSRSEDGKRASSSEGQSGDTTEESNGNHDEIQTCFEDNGSFALGGQFAGGLSQPDTACDAGMSWVKFQVKYEGQDPGATQGLVDHAHGEGFKVLLSIPGPINPGSINHSGYLSFIRAVAAFGPDAIEVWNEPNLDLEWPDGQISASDYVNDLLKPAYAAIKQVGGEIGKDIMVISAAPAPTGYYGGGCDGSGCDDLPYIHEMKNAGAENAMDCLGAHFNSGATSPTATSGHPGDDGNHHHSWYLGKLLDTYRGVFPNHPICLTEIGYLSGDGYGDVPGGFSWAAGTTVAQQAQWLGESVPVMASKNVRLGIIWNVDFTKWGDDPQGGYAIVRKDGSCPACNTLRSAMDAL